jgi:predicted DNA-binding transcriptional regulator AlpA
VAAEVARWQTLADTLRRRVVAPTAATAEDRTVLLGVVDLARLLGRRRSWVEHHVDDLPPRRSLMGSPVWMRSDVERWIKTLPKYGE